jgi:hypothetical protein
MNRPPLADRQERAAAVLEALPPDLAREARQLLAELAMVSCGSITSYSPMSTSGGGPRDPSTGDQWPAHHELLHRLAEAVSATDVRDALNWGRHELAALRRAPQNAKVTGESEAERAKRIVKEGEGWGMHDVANTLNVPVGEVRRARVAHQRDPIDGRSIRPTIAPRDRARSMHERGVSTREIARLLGKHQTQVVRWLRQVVR